MHKHVEDRSLAELSPSYEVAAAYLVHMLEARIVNLNPFMQQMFLKLRDIEDFEKKDFILETLRREFRDVVIEARKVFEHFNMLGSPVKVVGTTKEYIKVPIPCKLVGLYEALEKNFDWICPENPFDESSEPKSVHKGSSKTHLDTIQFIVEKTSAVDLNASFDIT
jgi:5'(3')-deoxyribonucleotidase